MNRITLLIITLAAATSMSCAGNGSSADAGDTFIAFTDTFQPFRTWTSFQSAGPPASEFPGHPDVLGPRAQYINMTPPHGSTQFPVGTVIVEVRQDTGKIFAAVKRGGGFNAGGQLNWEDFELAEAGSAAGGAVSIVWRGVGPPAGDTYGGDPNGCNTCHVACGGHNDFICSAQLQLSSF